MSKPTAKPSSQPATGVREVRYSLRAMLDEIEIERAHSSLAREMVDQEEILKIFSAKRQSRREERI